ncbi:MAG: formylglycine-generating enzyme family protein, partial [Planctomycetes bacterium]|nr:formylglycine-generating enzyme family protein [Planctomycetota bacterium]
GLYDLHGNVWEWCEDKGHDSYNGAPTDGSAWISKKGADQVLRGGSWCGNAGFARSADRDDGLPDFRYDYVGFRVALSAVPPEGR